MEDSLYEPSEDGSSSSYSGFTEDFEFEDAMTYDKWTEKMERRWLEKQDNLDNSSDLGDSDSDSDEYD